MDSERPAGDFVRCGLCGSALVCPTDYLQCGVAWLVCFRCGECGRMESQWLDERELETLDRALDDASDEIVTALATLRRETSGRLVERLDERG